MFEKEAEEYLTEKRKSFNEHEQLCWGDVYKDFQKGAEFGYNKANEWHYVKDELPRIINDYWSNDLIFLTKDCSGNITKHFGNFSFRKDFEEYNTEDRFTLDEVIAWKEIVLPELKKNEIKSEIFPEITLPKGSAEHINEIIADAEKRLKEIE